MDELLDETEVGDFVPYQSGETTRYTLYGGRVSFTAEQYRAVQALLSTSLQSARRDERKFVIKEVDELFKRGQVFPVEWERLASELEDPLLERYTKTDPT